jgi:small nuclear ribonucleoprotein (snRNP)-like protein
MDPGLVKMVQEQLNRLLSDVENMKSENGEEIRIIQQHLRNFEEEFAGLKREVGVLQQAQSSTDVKVGQLDTNHTFAQQQLISLSGKVDQLTSGQEDLNFRQNRRSSTSVKIDQLQEAFEQGDLEQKGQENRSIGMYMNINISNILYHIAWWKPAPLSVNVSLQMHGNNINNDLSSIKENLGRTLKRKCDYVHLKYGTDLKCLVLVYQGV